MDLDNNFGEVLQSLRNYKGLSITEVSEGICSEEDLVLFEGGKKSPTLVQLANFADKLKVEINYFFNFSMTSSFNYVVAVFNLIEKYKGERNYKAVSEIIQREKNNPSFIHSTQKQFLLWHEAICIFYLEGDKEKAVQHLKEAIRITNPEMAKLTEREAEILVSWAIIEKDDNNYQNSVELFEKVLEHLKDLPHLLNPKVLIKAIYALSQLLTKMGRFAESLEYCEQGIKNCLSNDLLYLFGDLHYQTGENYFRIGNRQLGTLFMEKAASIFELQDNPEYVLLVKKELNKLIEELEVGK
ncbi:helix-turn-helix domain-containing protein [Bacillus infantis]|uniref:helix-turn-helix domain-containing protein n=1 Tax=Bacillus infantis TaxID=324767 RepID=UPI003CED45DC